MSFSSRGGPAHFSYPSSQGGGGARRKTERKKLKGQQKQKPQDTREKTKDGRNSKIKGRDIQYSTDGRWDEKVKN